MNVLLAPLPLVATTGTGVPAATVGAVTVIEVGVNPVTVAVVPLIVTVVPDVKFVPVNVTADPLTTGLGENAVIVGAA